MNLIVWINECGHTVASWIICFRCLLLRRSAWQRFQVLIARTEIQTIPSIRVYWLLLLVGYSSRYDEKTREQSFDRWWHPLHNVVGVWNHHACHHVAIWQLPGLYPQNARWTITGVCKMEAKPIMSLPSHHIKQRLDILSFMVIHRLWKKMMSQVRRGELFKAICEYR